MNLLLVYAGIREQELSPLLDIFVNLEIPVKLCQFLDRIEVEIESLAGTFSHMLFVPSNESNGSEGSISYLCGFFQAEGGRVCVYNRPDRKPASFLKHLKALNSLAEIRDYYTHALTEWNNRIKVKQSIQQLKNQGIYFSDDSFFNMVRDGSTKAVELFLKAGMSHNLRDRRGVSLLSHAVRNGHLSLVQLLLEHGADVNTVADDRGNTVLMDACSEGNSDICRCLLDAGAEVNQKNKDRQTAMILAVGAKSAEIAALLLEYGADTESRDNLGMNAVEYAKLFGIEEIFNKK